MDKSSKAAPIKLNASKIDHVVNFPSKYNKVRPLSTFFPFVYAFKLISHILFDWCYCLRWSVNEKVLKSNGNCQSMSYVLDGIFFIELLPLALTLWIIYRLYNLHAGAWVVWERWLGVVSTVYISIDRKCHFEQKKTSSNISLFFLLLHA